MKTHTENLIDNLNRLFRYEAETGKLFWKVKAGNGRTDRIGKEAGYIRADGHRIVCIHTTHKMFVHQIVWLLEKGVYPGEIDHINRDPSDNRISNLRDVPHAENIWNVEHYSTNRSGVKGVNLHACGKWEASICHNGERTYLGLHNSFKEAVAARKAKEVELGRVIPQSLVTE